MIHLSRQRLIFFRLRIEISQLSRFGKKLDFFAFSFSSTPQYSSIQQDCFKNLSIFSSDTPYVIIKMGELVCIDYVRCKSRFLSPLSIRRLCSNLAFTSQFYQQPANRTIDPNDFTQTLNTLDSVSAPLQASTSLTRYQVNHLQRVQQEDTFVHDR